MDNLYRRSHLTVDEEDDELVSTGRSEGNHILRRKRRAPRATKRCLLLILTLTLLWGINRLLLETKTSYDEESEHYKSCRRMWYGRWKCQDCGNDGKSCRVLSPREICPPFYRQEWDQPPRSSSRYNPASNSEVSHNMLTSYGVKKKVRRTYDLASCSLKIPSCFNLTKCNHVTGDSPSLLKVYAGKKNESFIASKHVERAGEKNIVVRVYDPSEACLIVITGDMYETPQSLSTSEIWNNGKNHFIWDVQGDNPIKTVGNFEMASTSCWAFTNAHMRMGYDMSIALPPKWKRPSRFSGLDIHRPRRVLLSFKGNVMDSFMPYYQHRWLAAEYWDTNDKDVVVDVQCKYRGLLGGRLKRFYYPKHYDFTDSNSYGELLLNSTFGFAPGGSGVSSFRFAEILAADGIPVVMPELVPPFSPEIDWSDCVVRISEERIIDLPRILRGMPSDEVKKRQRVCATLHRNILGSGLDGQFEVAMMLWQSRLKNALQIKAETRKFWSKNEPKK